MVSNRIINKPHCFPNIISTSFSPLQVPVLRGVGGRELRGGEPGLPVPNARSPRSPATENVAGAPQDGTGAVQDDRHGVRAGGRQGRRQEEETLPLHIAITVRVGHQNTGRPQSAAVGHQGN